jgi:hypothetical protein
MTAYTWVPEVGALKVSHSERPAPIPILAPTEPSRLKRWKRILSWYDTHSAGRLAGPSGAAASAAPESQDPSGHVIAALDEGAAAVASVLAALDGRPLVRCKDATHLTDIANGRDVRSLLVVARPPQLKNRTILELSASLSLPWGIITGRDLPSLSFAVAKLLAARRRSRLPRFHLDAIAQRRWLWPGGNGSSPARDDALDAATTLETLTSSDLDTLSIHCHGDGAHGNFNSVVLCGVADQREIGVDGWLGGCEVRNGSSRCKRVHNQQRRPFRFGDLRARRMCLFTCNGFSVAGDVYPSDGSFILSAVEGYPSAVLTTDRRLPFDPWLFSAVPALLELEDSLGRLASILNDIGLRVEGARPYLLYGDPADTAFSRAPDSGTAVREKRSSAVFALGGLADAQVLGLDEQRPEVIFRRGAENALLVARDVLGEPRLVDRSGDLEGHKAWLVNLGARARRARRIGSAVRHHQRALLEGAAAADAFAELGTILGRVEEAVDEGARLIAEVEQSGVWSPVIETWHSHLRLLTSLWDAHFTAFLDEYLLEADLHNVLRDSFFLVSKSARGPCPRCGCALTEGAARSPLLGGARHRWLECTTCGPREAGDAGLPRLYASIPKAARPGEVIRVTVKWSPNFKRPLDPRGFGLLVTHLKDSGRGSVSYRSVEPVGGKTHSLNVPFSPDSALEIHTLRFALVRDLNVSYLRLRIPCVGSVDVD